MYVDRVRRPEPDTQEGSMSPGPDHRSVVPTPEHMSGTGKDRFADTDLGKERDPSPFISRGMVFRS